MKLAVVIVLLSIAYIGGSNAKDCPPSPPAKRTMQRLRETLFCDYSPQVRPVKNVSKAVNVSLHFMLEEISLSADHVMHFEGFLEYIWTDSFLVWNPSEYDGIIFVNGDGEIWLPDLTTNVITMTGVEHLTPTNCVLNNLGVVRCISMESFRSPCKLDLRLWPFDTQNCSISFSSYLHYEHQLNLTLTPITADFYRSEHEWKMLGAGVERRIKTIFAAVYPFIQYTFIVRRQASAIAAATVFPAIAIMLVTLVTFFMGRHLVARVIICGFSMLGFITELSYILYIIPSNGDVVPVLVILLRDGLVLSAFAIIITMTRGILGKSESLPPQWISRAMDKLELSLTGRLLCLDTPVKSTKDDEEAILESATKWKPWTTFNILLDRISFIVSLCVVLYLLMGFRP